MRRKSPPPAVTSPRKLRVFRRDLAAVVIDDDEMQTRGLEEARELIHPGKSRTVFCLGDDVMGHTGA